MKRSLAGAAPRAQGKGDGISFFLEGAQGGKPLRHFVVGQGGYHRLEAEEGEEGLLLTVRGGQPIGHLTGRLGVTATGSALTLTLPAAAATGPDSADARRAGQEAGLPAPAAPKLEERPKRPEPLTPEAILRLPLTPGASRPPRGEAAAPKEKGSATAAPALVKAAAPFRPGEAEAAPAKSEPLKPSDLGAGAPDLSALLLQMGAALGGMLALLLAGLAAFKKWGARAAGRLGAGGKVVRTLHRVYLAPKQSIAIVEVAGEILVIGISGQSIAMLTKVENQAALAKLRSGGEASFVEQLTRFMASPKTAAKAPGGAQGDAEAAGPARGAKALPAPGVPGELLKAMAAAAAKQNGGAARRPDREKAPAPPAQAPVAEAAKEGNPFTLSQEAGGKAVARLRERLGRVSPRWTATGAVS